MVRGPREGFKNAFKILKEILKKSEHKKDPDADTGILYLNRLYTDTVRGIQLTRGRVLCGPQYRGNQYSYSIKGEILLE